MHLKSKSESLKQDSNMMANSNGNDNDNYALNNNDNSAVISSSGSNNQNKNNSNSNNNNNNNNNNNSNNNNVECGSIKTTTSDNNGDIMELKIKKQALEQRKVELEKLLNEKNWLLQQIQKQESQILHGNFEYLNFNDIFANLAQQYKEEQEDASNNSGISGPSNTGSGILRRKSKSISSGCKENQSGNANNNNNSNNRSSEISNRSSEYDNYPRKSDDGSNIKNVSTLTLDSGSIGIGVGLGMDNTSQSQNPNSKNVLKKRSTSSSAASMTYLQLQRQHMLQQQAEQQILQQHFKNAHDMGIHHSQQTQKLPGYLHYHPNQQQPPKQYHSPLGQHQQHQQQQGEQIDAISLYSVNSANIATLRQQPIAPQQQPIVVQCDKYYLSPTHQNYNDGGFIKSSQNIKKYVSPMSSPTQGGHIVAATSYEQPTYRHLKPQQHQSQNLLPMQQMPSHGYSHGSQHQFDVVSLLPTSYATLNRETPGYNLRWRSQLNIPHHSSMQPLMQVQDLKSNSSDLISQIPPARPESNFDVNYYHHLAGTKSKPLDEISISSLNSETQQDTQKRTKSKQWLESSLDGPVPTSSSSNNDFNANESTVNALPTATTTTIGGHPVYNRTPASSSIVQGQTHPNAPYARTKLSSQSMSSGHHYASNVQKNPHGRQIQDDEGRYMKLSQSTSYLNSIETNSTTGAYKLDAVNIDLPQFRNLPPKMNAADLTSSSSIAPPPRPPRMNVNNEKVVAQPSLPGGVAQISNTPLSQDIRIESPKNMTVVQQATFQPYKEITKPFEMSDFYKYSTKFRQKDNTNAHE